MAKNAANDVDYYLSIAEANKTDLANIRTWKQLKIAFDADLIWVKGFDYTQIHSLEVKCIPSKTLYYAKGEKLFLLNSQLPDRNVPQGLWTPIDRALPIQLPPLNHNYFGLSDRISVRLIPSETEVQAVAMITSTDVLGSYLETAPSIRLQRLTWALLHPGQALILGTPLLPIPGAVFWRRNSFLLPAGFDFDLYLLADALNQMINPGSQNWVIWRADNTCFLVQKNDLMPLSISSYRTSQPTGGL